MSTIFRQHLAATRRSTVPGWVSPGVTSTTPSPSSKSLRSRPRLQWLLDQAAASEGLVLGVVGWIDMAAADAPDALARLSANPLPRAIRPMLQDLPDARWVLQRALDPAFRALIGQDLAFDLLVKAPQLDGALELLGRYPELRAVIDHGAKPAIASGAWQPWADAIRHLAHETGAYCKLSGLVTEAARDWKTNDLRRYADHIIECFGADRILWGSDWPVALLATDYARWIRVAMDLIGGLPPTDRAKIMGDNATAFYRLRCGANNRSNSPVAD